MRIFFKVGGTIISALSTVAFNVLAIKGVASLFGYSVDWRWLTLASFVFFLGFVMWWIIGLESHKRQIENAKPNLVFTEYRESPFYNRETGQPKYHGLQAWFINKPKKPTDNSIAKDVTAKITFYDKNTKKSLSVYGLWVLAEAYDFAGYTGATNKLDNIPPNDEPCKLAIALKWQEDESAYAFVKESFLHSQAGDGRELVREIKKGTHYVEVQIRGTRIDRPPLWFLLTNPGQNRELSLSDPIKKPDLGKEGFPT